MLRKISGILAVVVVLGFATSVLREGNLCDFYVLAYSGVLALYPYDEGTRYLLPIHPFLILYLIDGFGVVARAVKSAAASAEAPLITRAASLLPGVGMAALLATIVAAGLFEVAALAAVNLQPDPRTFTNATTVKVSRWIIQNTDKNDVIMDDQAAIMYRLTGRKTFRFPLSTDVNFLRERVLASGVRFIVVLNERQYEYYRPSTMRRFEQLRSVDPRMFTPIYVFEQGIIYRVTLRHGPSRPLRGTSASNHVG